MAISIEIEKLERRWQQTSGLVFAPLAEAYRKAGLHARAFEILEQGLGLHPDYAPALIVRARCHLDTGDMAEAESAFNQALGRDPTDPIALRGLADVFERTGRTADAVDRLQVLVDVDPRNTDARLMLERLQAAPIVAEGLPEPTMPVVEELPPSELSARLDSLEFDVVNLSGVEAVPALPEEPATDTVEENLGLETFAVEAIEAPVRSEPSDPIQWTPAPSVLDLSEPEATEEPVLEFEVIPPPAEAVIESEALKRVWPEDTVEEPEHVEELPPAVAGATVPQFPEPESLPEPIATWSEPVVAAAETVDEIEPADEVEPAYDEFEESLAEIEARAEEVPAPVEEPVAAEYASSVETPQPAARVEEPALIVTESMAELFLKQGHRELALAVYRQLHERNSENDQISGAIARLEQELAPPPASVSPRKAWAASETGGRSIERRLQAVLHSPPPSTASTVLPPAFEHGPEPTRPAGEALPLSAVFGDEPGARAQTGAEPQGQGGEPSYDDFFGAGPTEPAAAPAPRGEGEDLRQFNEWLKGLKR